MTTLYHVITWNWDAPHSDLQHAWQLGAELDAKWNPRGRTQEHYWTPANPVEGGGLYTIRRVWTDLQALTEAVAEVNALRESDPILREVVSAPEIRNDDDYNPPA